MMTSTINEKKCGIRKLSAIRSNTPEELAVLLLSYFSNIQEPEQLVQNNGRKFFNYFSMSYFVWLSRPNLTFNFIRLIILTVLVLSRDC